MNSALLQAFGSLVIVVAVMFIGAGFSVALAVFPLSSKTLLKS